MVNYYPTIEGETSYFFASLFAFYQFFSIIENFFLINRNSKGGYLLERKTICNEVFAQTNEILDDLVDMKIETILNLQHSLETDHLIIQLSCKSGRGRGRNRVLLFYFFPSL